MSIVQRPLNRCGLAHDRASTLKAPLRDHVCPTATSGALPAVCSAIIELGDQPTVYDGETTLRRQVALVFSFGPPPGGAVVGKLFNLTFAERSNLRKFLESWEDCSAGEAGDVALSDFLGQPALVTVARGTSKSGATYTRLDAIAPLPEDLAAPPFSRRDLFLFEIRPGASLGSLPVWLPRIFGKRPADMIASSPTWRDRGLSPALDGDDDACDYDGDFSSL